MIYWEIFDLSVESEDAFRIFGTPVLDTANRKLLELIIHNPGHNFALVNRYVREAI